MTPLPGPPRPSPGRLLTPRLAHLPHARRHGPRQSRTERPREAQRPPLLVGQQCRPYRIRIPGRRVHDRQSGRFRHRSHPARHGPVQGGTALRTEHRARLPAASALGRQHQIGEVPPPPPHAHHCANAEADRPPLWITPCGKPRPGTRTAVPTTITGPIQLTLGRKHSPRINPVRRFRSAPLGESRPSAPPRIPHPPQNKSGRPRQGLAPAKAAAPDRAVPSRQPG